MHCCPLSVSQNQFWLTKDWCLETETIFDCVSLSSLLSQHNTSAFGKVYNGGKQVPVKALTSHNAECESFHADAIPTTAASIVPLVFRLDEGSSSSTCLERDGKYVPIALGKVVSLSLPTQMQSQGSELL